MSNCIPKFGYLHPTSRLKKDCLTAIDKHCTSLLLRVWRSFVPSSTRLQNPPGAFQALSIKPARCDFLWFYQRWVGCVVKWFVLKSETICTGCSILYAVPVSDFLPDSICSVQFDVACVKNRLATHSPWSRAESHLEASETRCYICIWIHQQNYQITIYIGILLGKKWLRGLVTL